MSAPRSWLLERETPKSHHAGMKAAILLFPGAEELDALAPFEALQSAARLGASLEVALVSVGDPAPLRLARGAVVIPAAKFSGVDLLIVPGGGWADHSAEGARAEAQRPATLDLVRAAAASGATLAAVCTGTLILASAGLLRGRPAITHHSAIDDLAAFGAEVVRARVVDDGDVVTCGGVTSGLDLALWLVERFFGAELSAKVEDYLEYERRGPIWRDGALR